MNWKDTDKLKQTKNLFKKLIKDEKSIFCATDGITRTLLNKVRKSLHEQDFYKYDLDLEDKNVFYENKNTKTRITFYDPFVKKKKYIDRSPALYRVKSSFELVYADMGDVHFFSNSTINKKYCLQAVDLFTSETFAFPMKNRNLLPRKLELFYRYI